MTEIPRAGGPAFIESVVARSVDLRGQGDLVRAMVITLAGEIVAGRLAPGQELTSVELGRRFGTSRTPVRETLAVLQREGLVEVQPRRRARVAGLTPTEIRDLYAVRSSLYALLSESIASDATTEEVDRLKGPLELMRKAAEEDDRERYFYGTVAFRDVEASICPNAQIGPLIDSLGLRVYRLRRFGLYVPGRAQNSYRDYVRIVEAYRERDTQLAAAVARSLMSRALRTIEQNWGTFDLDSSPEDATSAPG